MLLQIFSVLRCLCKCFLTLRGYIQYSCPRCRDYFTSASLRVGNAFSLVLTTCNSWNNECISRSINNEAAVYIVNTAVLWKKEQLSCCSNWLWQRRVASVIAANCRITEARTGYFLYFTVVRLEPGRCPEHCSFPWGIPALNTLFLCSRPHRKRLTVLTDLIATTRQTLSVDCSTVAYAMHAIRSEKQDAEILSSTLSEC